MPPPLVLALHARAHEAKWPGGGPDLILDARRHRDPLDPANCQERWLPL
jgi:hypothetical protein